MGNKRIKTDFKNKIKNVLETTIRLVRSELLVSLVCFGVGGEEWGGDHYHSRNSDAPANKGKTGSLSRRRATQTQIITRTAV
jgi:hypothetical protein